MDGGRWVGRAAGSKHRRWGKKGRQAAAGKRMGKELGNGKGWQAFGQEREAQAAATEGSQAFAEVVS